MNQFDELPEGWEKVRLFEISRPKQWRTISKKDLTETGYPVYGANGKIGFFSQYNHERSTILITCRGATCGTLNISEPYAWINGNAMALDELEEDLINFQFGFYALKARGLEDTISGSAQPQITREGLEKVTLPLPPLNEQRRIVEKIEALTARSRKAREALEAIPALLDQFRQSVLAAAFRGDLTADWREQNPDVELAEEVLGRIKKRRLSQVSTALAKSKVEEIYQYCETEDSERLPFGWQYSCLEKMCDSFQYGTSSKSHPEGELAVLRMGNLQKGEIDWSDLAYSSDLQEIEKYRLNPGDVLFNRTNSPELVGKTSIYRGGQPAIFAGYLIRIKNFPELDSEYLNFCLNTNYAKAYCWQVKSDGVSQSNINAQKLAKFEIPLCSYDEQREIVRRIHNLLNAAKSIEDQYQESFAFSGQLDQSILAKAFRGELVPQDPNDEPASVLLERIRAEREKLGGKKRAKSKM